MEFKYLRVISRSSLLQRLITDTVIRGEIGKSRFLSYVYMYVHVCMYACMHVFIYLFVFMHFCPGTMTTHAESISSDLQRGLERRLQHTQH